MRNMHKSQNRIRWNRIHLLIYIESCVCTRIRQRVGFVIKRADSLDAKLEMIDRPVNFTEI